MNLKKIGIICPIIVALFSAVLLLNKNSITLFPWVAEEPISFITYASGNDERLAIISNSEKTVTVLAKTEDGQENLVYKLDAKPRAQKSFSGAKFVELDEQNNLYVLDVSFGGAFNKNVERVIKYSPEGVFLDTLYERRYTNEDFLTSKGKMSGMAYFENMLYLVRFENDGFYLERASAVSHAPAEIVVFFEYPNALRDLVYVNINVRNKNLSVTTKAGGIKQYNFGGRLTYVRQARAPTPPQAAEDVPTLQVSRGASEELPSEAAADEPLLHESEAQSIPWTAVSDGDGNIIYADILSGEIVLIDSKSGESRVLYTASEYESPYYRINCAGNRLFASSYDETTGVAYTSDAQYRGGGSPDFVKIHSYSYSTNDRYIRIALFILLVFDAIMAFISAVAFIKVLSKLKIDDSLQKILLSGVCITFGAAIAAVLIIDEMDTRYNEKAYNELENVSRLTAASVDIDMLTSLTSPSQFDDAEYLELKDTIKKRFFPVAIQRRTFISGNLDGKRGHCIRHVRFREFYRIVFSFC
ncbi:MAG: hypothetical protein Ta2A_18210 [Treponemataceae bacterium]|nr:MAG: hypothetical protein Ta2A_18210 [Treponemataceae bacterium]